MALLRHLHGFRRYKLHDGLLTCLPAVCHEDQTFLETWLMYGVWLFRFSDGIRFNMGLLFFSIT